MCIIRRPSLTSLLMKSEESVASIQEAPRVSMGSCLSCGAQPAAQKDKLLGAEHPLHGLYQLQKMGSSWHYVPSRIWSSRIWSRTKNLHSHRWFWNSLLALNQRNTFIFFSGTLNFIFPIFVLKTRVISAKIILLGHCSVFTEISPSVSELRIKNGVLYCEQAIQVYLSCSQWLFCYQLSILFPLNQTSLKFYLSAWILKRLLLLSQRVERMSRP